MKILVTGATGFVGTVLLPLLAERYAKAALTALVLPGETIPAFWERLGIRTVRGDITDRDAVDRAVAGQSHIIHLAGFISYWKYHRDLLTAINVEGVMHLTSASLRNGVKRFVHISSVGAIGFHKDGTPADETVPFNWPADFYYMVSKFEGQQVVEGAVEAGLPAVILNPASIMGPGDPNPSTPKSNMFCSGFFPQPITFYMMGISTSIVNDTESSLQGYLRDKLTLSDLVSDCKKFLVFQASLKSGMKFWSLYWTLTLSLPNMLIDTQSHDR